MAVLPGAIAASAPCDLDPASPFALANGALDCFAGNEMLSSSSTRRSLYCMSFELAIVYSSTVSAEMALASSRCYANFAKCVMKLIMQQNVDI